MRKIQWTIRTNHPHWMKEHMVWINIAYNWKQKGNERNEIENIENNQVWNTRLLKIFRESFIIREWYYRKFHSAYDWNSFSKYYVWCTIDTGNVHRFNARDILIIEIRKTYVKTHVLRAHDFSTKTKLLSSFVENNRSYNTHSNFVSDKTRSMQYRRVVVIISLVAFNYTRWPIMFADRRNVWKEKNFFFFKRKSSEWKTESIWQLWKESIK